MYHMTQFWLSTSATICFLNRIRCNFHECFWATLPIEFTLSSGIQVSLQWWDLLHLLASVSMITCYKLTTMENFLSSFNTCIFIILKSEGKSKSEYIWVIDHVWHQDGRVLAKFFSCMLWESRSIDLHQRTRPYILSPWLNKLSQ